MSTTPSMEDARLDAVRRYDILDTPRDGSFDRVTALAARFFDVPMAIVSIVDADRIWFKSHHGLDLDEIGREPGLCASAILQNDPWVVTNAAVDPRTLTNALVASEFGLRFYAGIPLTTVTGHNLGTLCVLDHEPREVTEAEIATLQDLAAIVVNELELRLSARATVSLEQQLRHQSQQATRALQQIALPDVLPNTPNMEFGAEYLPAAGQEVGGDWYDAFALNDGTVAVTVGDVSGHGLAAAAAMGQIRNAIRAYVHEGHEPSAILLELDNLVQHVGDGQFATVALFIIDTHSGEFRASNAAHLPPVRIRDGACTLLDWPPAPPIGAGLAKAFPVITGALADGECLLLYTDGLVERRDETIDDGINRLITAIKESTDGDILKAAVSLTVDRELGDDAALIVVSRVKPEP